VSQIVPVDIELLRDLLDDEPCWFDHHGGCQGHGYLSLKPGEKCPQQELRDLLNGERHPTTYCKNCAAIGTIEAGEPVDESGWRDFACTVCGTVYGGMTDKGSLDIGIIAEES
jgi:hypothetical protein